MAAVSVYEPPVGGFSFENCRRCGHVPGRVQGGSGNAVPGSELGCGLSREVRTNGGARGPRPAAPFLLLPSSLLETLRASAAQCGPALQPFILSFALRNAILEADFAKKGSKLPMARKTGTTIAGVVYKDGIVLGADTRATEGMVVADKNSADTDMTTQLISSNLELHSLSTGRLPRVVTANRMLKQMLFRYQGYIGAALVLGGVDVTGPHLYSIYPHGSTDKLPYVTMGECNVSLIWILREPQKCQNLRVLRDRKTWKRPAKGLTCSLGRYFEMWARVKGAFERPVSSNCLELLQRERSVCPALCTSRLLLIRQILHFKSMAEKKKSMVGDVTLVAFMPEPSSPGGSGSLAAMAVFEDKFRPDMEWGGWYLLNDIPPVSALMIDVPPLSNPLDPKISKNKPQLIVISASSVIGARKLSDLQVWAKCQ
ncbi:hypothetical protein DBR06_SOUSAS310219, partial [Sousa chinensis]